MILEYIEKNKGYLTRIDSAGIITLLVVNIVKINA